MRKIIIKGQKDFTSYVEFECVFWLTTPAAQIPFRANASLTSTAPGITAGELTSLQSGSVTELIKTISFQKGTAIGAIGSGIVAAYNQEQLVLNNAKDFQYFGSSWDGTSWTVQGG